MQLVFGAGELAGGDRLEGAAGRISQARHERGAGGGLVDGAADPGWLMGPVPPLSGGFAQGRNRANATGRGRERRPVHG